MEHATNKNSEICLEKCYFYADNCRQKEDGSWDCSTNPSHCERHCNDK